MNVRPATDRDAALLRRATWRLGLQIALCVAVIVVVLSGVAVLVVVQAQHRASARLLDQAISRADDVGDPPAGVWLVADDHGTRHATPGLPAGLPDEQALARTVAGGGASTIDYHVHGTEYQVHTARRHGATVQAALDLTANHDERTRLVTALLLAGGLGLVLAAAAGVWLSRRAVRPMAGALATQRRFVSDASHELRTPLTLLSTRVQMLRRHLEKSGADAALRDEADGVVDDAGHLAEILEDLLLAADPTAVPAERFDLVALAGRVADAHTSQTVQRDVTLSTHLPDQPALITGSPTAIQRAVTALLDNAIRHATSSVTMTVTAGTSTVGIEVADDGPGIDPDVLPHMFDRFATSRPATNTGPRRYGLGLALVSEIATRHGGDIIATSTSGGSVLRLELPADRSS